jgi:hypothetical protein
MEQNIPIQNPIVAQLVRKSPIFYGTRMFIAVFIKAPNGPIREQHAS